VLNTIKGKIWEKVIIPFVSVRGWRPSHATMLTLPFEKMRFGFDEENEIKIAARKVSTHTMVSFERLATLWNQVRHLDQIGVPGDLVECGVWRGGSSGMMALAHLHSGAPRRNIHLFDSFEGLPEPMTGKDGDKAVAYSNNRANGITKSIGKCVGPLEDNKELMESIVGYPKSKLIYHQGWFEKTIPALPKEFGPIALLRLDGDWYESTKICLDNLYDRVSSGGIVVIDDYGHWEGCKKAVDEFFQERAIKPYLHYIDYTGRYFFKP
jgi:O-methyltransferase